MIPRAFQNFTRKTVTIEAQGKERDGAQERRDWKAVV